MTSAIDALRGHYADRTAAARAHKANGGRVIAYLCDNVPVELIEAADIFPLRIHGGSDVSLRPAQRLVDTLYPPDVTQRPDFVGAMLGRLLGGEYDFADAVIVPHNRNAVQAIYRELHDAALEHELQLPEVWYLDRAWSAGVDARAYNHASIGDLRQKLEQLTGSAISDAAIGTSIAAHNQRRRLVARLASARAERGLPGSLAIDLIGATWSLAAKMANPLLAMALDALDTRFVFEGRRLYLGGSPQDHPALYRLVERLGATIVAEDHCWGNRAADLPIDETDDTMGALADRFHRFPACSILFPIAEKRASVLARAQAARVDGAIFFVAAGDTTQAWETPGEVATLRDAGIPTLHLRRQPYAADSSALEDTLRAFIADLGR